MTKPILQLEVNEIAWRFMNEFRNEADYPNIHNFLNNSRLYTSKAVDSGEMSPWIVWPTIHRGMNENFHKIKNLGQDPKTFEGTPIWDEVLRKGNSVGVFGAIQSWPPVYPGKEGFFIPDTFAHDEKCFPDFLEPLQKFNLDLVSKNMRVRKGSLLPSINWKVLKAIPRSGIRLKTLLRICHQLYLEKKDPRYAARRAIFQNILFWDVFKKLYSPTKPPTYASYFSNHVAGCMHRYWNYMFPNDFPSHLRPKDKFHRETLNFSMKVLDEMLGDVMSWMKENPDLTVVLLTGLGQDFIVRGRHSGTELTLENVGALLNFIGVRNGNFRKLLAMTPNTAVEIFDEKLLAKAITDISGITTASGAKPFSTNAVAHSLTISLATPSSEDCKAGFFTLHGKTIYFETIGVRSIEIGAGTAYHIPEGIFAIAGRGKEEFAANWSEEIIPDDKIKAELLKLMEI